MTALFMMDTDTCIYLKNRRPPSIAKRFDTLKRGEVVISLITFGELYSGALKSNESQAALKNINQLINRLPVLPMPIEIAQTYASIRSSLELKGQVIGANDLWIAAHAVFLGLTLITNNTKEFSRVDGLMIENWV
jgi:tRNA(fMet)-specific endonuclease VapC